jgi:hypothetical protein
MRERPAGVPGGKHGSADKAQHPPMWLAMRGIRGSVASGKVVAARIIVRCRASPHPYKHGKHTFNPLALLQIEHGLKPT